MVVHPITRNKILVKLLHAAERCMSYDQVMKADCSLAALSLKSFDPKSGVVVPPNFKCQSHFNNSGLVLHIVADNIDISTDTIDGTKTFHATQMVAFRRKCTHSIK